MEIIENVQFALEASEIQKSFPNGTETVEVLKGVNLQLRRGETVAIQGTSGSGKTTFLNIISGLEALDTGELYWNGIRIHGQSGATLAALRAEQVGMVFQAYYLLPELNVLDNVILAARLMGKATREDQDRARELLVRVGLEDRLHYSVEKLSGGERQRVAIARALLNRPKLILADEPTGNLDSKNAQNIFQIFYDFTKEYKINSLIVTHNMDLAKKMDQIITIEDGQISS